SGNGRVFLLDNCQRITIDNPRYEQTAYTTLDATKGGSFFTIFDSLSSGLSRGIIINNPQMKGGISGLEVTPQFRAAKTTEGIRVFNGHFDSVYYGINFENGGDDFEGDITTTN